MNSRERVRKAVLFEGPDRIPYDLPEAFGSDFLSVGPAPDPNWKPKIKTETEWEDEFGCIWRKLKLSTDKTMGQVKVHPLSDYRMLENFKFPDYQNPERYREAQKIISANRKEKFVLAGIPFSIIHRLQYLRGFEQGLTDPYLYPEQVGLLLDKLADIAIESIENFAKLGIDGIMSCDDWGLEDRPMINPEIFRKFFKPRYARVYQFAHQKGILAFLHSCGYIIDLLEDFIDAGLNVVQMDQQENMGMERLSKLFGGRLCFWCPVDIQKTMVKGTIADVENYAKALINNLGKFNGGFIAKWYPSPEAAGHSPEKIDAMAKTFVEYGKSFYNISNGSISRE
ncbi:MAG: hypothetical protein CO162_01090 [bacterium (Candidatus Ratteibacteria) CG_4_9_14_3_um_filter_41_21]|uniref:Uroporphyrinogen decarboxylase (URO-D) domain-containing protein n=2 Tax=Candidatus Ratteibacteria TaxID=2979319 RepID=A0A2M7YHI2_9BACT|nr:MAG: hypothetical protein CO162_01090 [bacterium (Candidatus Ratteibacteria) CG_4_9_14_3_um_filter_41_21]HCG76676.1 hypothetical protein [bacterium]